MKTQAPFSETFLEELYDRYSEAPGAFDKLDVLSSKFAEVAMTLYPDATKKSAIKQLAGQSKDLSLCYGYFLAIEKAKFIGLIGKEKRFSFHNLDALYILRSLSEFVAMTSKFEFPYELGCLTDSLHSKFNLAISKARLDSAVSDYLIIKQKKQLKKIKKSIVVLVALTLLNVLIAVSFYL